MNYRSDSIFFFSFGRITAKVSGTRLLIDKNKESKTNVPKTMMGGFNKESQEESLVSFLENFLEKSPMIFLQ